MNYFRGLYLKICFVSFSGGHWEELLCLKKISTENNSFFVTEKGSQSDEFKNYNIYTLSQINRREKGFIKKFFILFLEAKKILNREKPDIIITTGVLISFPFCLIGKCQKAKIIYIESFARVNKKSLTGRLVYPFADLFIVQWKPMLKYYPKAKYTGGIF